MTVQAALMGTGNPADSSRHIVGTVDSTNSAVGSTQAGANLLNRIVGLHNIKTSVSNGGVILAPGNGTADGYQQGDWCLVFNNTTNSIKLYPPVGGTINAGSSNAAVTLTTLQKALVHSIDGINFTALVG